MIGRSRELTALSAIVTGRAEQSCAAAIGESGIGKTTLLRAAVSELAKTTTVGWLLGRELQRLVPFAGLDGLIDLRAEAPEHGDPFAQVLVATNHLADHLAAKRPVVLCVDDAHWLDDVTLTVLDRLLDRLADADAHLVIGSRPTERRPVRQLLDRVAELGVIIELQPLTDDEADSLVESKLGRPPGIVMRELVRGAAGNPFLVNELIDALDRSDGLSSDADGNAELRDARIPRTLQAILTTRIDQLLPEAQQTLEIIAALGGDMSVETLARIVDIDPLRLDEKLNAAVRQGLIRRADGRLQLRHDLIRRALADAADPAIVRAVQLAAASSETDAATAAAFVTPAGPPFEQEHIEILARAADEIANRDAERAAELFALAIEHGECSSERPALDRRYVRALLRAGRLGDVSSELSRMGPVSDAGALALSLLDAQANQDQPDADLVASVLDDRHRLAITERTDVVGRLTYYAVRADAGRFRDWLVDAPAPDPSWSADARAHRWIASAALAGLDADLEGAARLAHRALQVAREGNAPPAAVVRAGLGFGVFGGDLAEHRGEAIDVLNETTRLAEDHGLVGLVPAAHAVLANAHWAAGNWDDAETGYRSALAAARDAEVPRWTAEAHTGLCHMLADRADDEAASAHLDACEAAAHHYQQWVGRRGWSPGGTGRGWVSQDALRARIAFGRGDDADAIESWSVDLRDPAAPRFAKAVSAMDLTVCALASGDRSATNLAAETLQPLPSEGLPMSLVQPLVVAAERRDLDAAIAAEEIATIGPVYAVAKAAEIVGLLARDLGQGEVAVDRLQRAYFLWERCGADGLAARDNAWLDDLGTQVARRREPRPVVGWGSLTHAEARVVHIVATGALYREVADQLHVSRRTVETHVANAMRKIQVRNRGELAASYWRHHSADGKSP